jgi:microcompartment protein CcmK/EutM
MILARIVGTVVATRKDPRLVSNKLASARRC